MLEIDLCNLPAAEIATKVKARELSASEVTEAHLARMDALEPKLHAFRTQTPEIARRMASQIDKDIAAGKEVRYPALFSAGLDFARRGRHSAFAC